MSSTEDRAYQSSAADFENSLRFLCEEALARLNPQITSPIERAMFIGFFALRMTIANRACLPGTEVTADHWFRVAHQEQIGRYRVDFMVEILDAGNVIGRIVIECDGHAFHERTKEQARNDRSRDRELTKQGFKVLRFTGSEIHDNVTSCVGDIVSIVMETRSASA